MINVESLVAMSLIHELAENIKNGAIPFSKVKSSDEVYEKIVYDDSKPAGGKASVYYPVIFSARVDEEHHDIELSYDELLKDMYASVSFHDVGNPELNYVRILVIGDSQMCADYVIQRSGFRLNGFDIKGKVFE